MAVILVNRPLSCLNRINILSKRHTIVGYIFKNAWLNVYRISAKLLAISAKLRAVLANWSVVLAKLWAVLAKVCSSRPKFYSSRPNVVQSWSNDKTTLST